MWLWRCSAEAAGAWDLSRHGETPWVQCPTVMARDGHRTPEPRGVLPWGFIYWHFGRSFSILTLSCKSRSLELSTTTPPFPPATKRKPIGNRREWNQPWERSKSGRQGIGTSSGVAEASFTTDFPGYLTKEMPLLGVYLNQDDWFPLKQSSGKNPDWHTDFNCIWNAYA